MPQFRRKLAGTVEINRQIAQVAVVNANDLQKGLEYGGWRKEDRALFLYKIGAIYESQLNNPDRARKYWEEAADKYPDTAYGRSARDKVMF